MLRTSPGAVGNLLATEALSLEFPQEGHAILAVREGQEEEEGKYRGQKKAIGDSETSYQALHVLREAEEDP